MTGTVIVKLTVLSRSSPGINVALILGFPMPPIPSPFLLADRQANIVRAHRMRGAVVAALIAIWPVGFPPPPAKEGG